MPKDGNKTRDAAAHEGILVLAGKQVGLELTTYLLEERAPVRQVIAATAEDRAMLALCERHGVAAEVFSPGLPARLAEGQRFAWLLNFWSPHVLDAAALGLAEHRLNVHPTLVPHGRGNDNAAWTIRRGLPAGVSLIEMSSGVDEGDVYAQREVAYTFPMRGAELHAMLQKEIVAFFKEQWPGIFAGRVTPRPQAGPVTTFRRRDTEADRTRRGEEAMPLREWITWALAHDFSPRTTAEVELDGRRYGLTISLQPLKQD
ncbi:MAG: hypothetical protein IT442_04510 [Phycisphaeraceae bacterium]|nr:hypothetical protein [Phycisphaeraceae bacterium]